jgi:arylsulfatase A-like enzyme
VSIAADEKQNYHFSRSSFPSRRKCLNRRDYIKASMLALGAAGLSAARAQDTGVYYPRSFPSPPPRTNGEPMPNILWICTDEQRADTIGGFNNDHIHTPRLRKLVDESVTFTNAFVQTPICSPSRASFLTGRYPHVTGLRANGQRIRPSERLVTRVLADHGYTCGLVGKLHLSPCADGRVEQRIDDGYEMFRWSHDLEDDWPDQNMWRVWLEQQGVTWPERPKDFARTKVRGVPIDPRYTQTAWCADEAIKFLREKKPLGPWLMSVNIVQPHHPFEPTAEYLSRYSADKLPNPIYKEGELETKPIYQSIDHRGAYGETNISFAGETCAEHREVTAAYYAMIEQIDTAVGQMLDALEESGQTDNTIVIFMSDHGEMLGDHGIYLKGPYFYDCLTRVPLIVRWPKQFKAGLRVDGLVELIDLAPTLLEAADIPVEVGIQGKSLMKLLRGKTTVHRSSVYCEYLDAQALYDVPPICSSVRDNRYKVAYYRGISAGELYDLQNDPSETHNLWTSVHHSDVREQMMTLLVDSMLGTTDPLPQRLALW